MRSQLLLQFSACDRWCEKEFVVHKLQYRLSFANWGCGKKKDALKRWNGLLLTGMDLAAACGVVGALFAFCEMGEDWVLLPTSGRITSYKLKVWWWRSLHSHVVSAVDEAAWNLSKISAGT
jgi:hypothetical protein